MIKQEKQLDYKPAVVSTGASVAVAVVVSVVVVGESKLLESDKTCGCCGLLLFGFGVGVTAMVLSNKQMQLDYKPAVVSTRASVTAVAVVSVVVVGKGKL